MNPLAHLPHRGVIEVAGDDRLTFLQGLLSNDLRPLAPGMAIWAAFLTPQGKWLADFFVIQDGERILLDAERASIADTLTRFGRYKLRSKVTLRDASADLAVYAAWNTPPATAAITVADPRLPEAGWRILAADQLPATATAEDWDQHRLTLGLPDGSRDLEPEKTVLLEAGFDELHGVSWKKGCFLGQELTARTKYRGLIKRRLIPVAVEGALPPSGTPVLRDGIEVGEMRSGLGHRGLATLRLEALHGPLRCGDTTLLPSIPGWMVLPEPA